MRRSMRGPSPRREPHAAAPRAPSRSVEAEAREPNPIWRRLATAGEARPLVPAERAAAERGFGRDFGDVRVHAGPRAAAMTRAMDARAVTSGAEVALGSSGAAGSLSRRFLLAHELAHVAQMRSGVTHGRGVAGAPRSEAAAEREADRMAVRVTFGLGPMRASVHRPRGSLLASPRSQGVEQIWTSTAEKGRVFDELRAQSPVTDPDLDALLGRIFTAGSDDLWLARTIVRHGPEPLWPTSAFDERRRRETTNQWRPERGRIRGELAVTAGGRPVDAYFFPGRSAERALVIAGVHGSEQGGIEVAEMLLETLHNALFRPYYTVIVVPTLFPDNAATRAREGATPTNRNFPDPGESLASSTPAGGTAPVDSAGRPILAENVALLRLIERFRPSRIASIHGTWDRKAAGIFTDRHTVSANAQRAATVRHLGDPVGLGLELAAMNVQAGARSASDEALALRMAREMEAQGHGRAVRGNDLGGTPHAQWSGSVPGGTSLGGWGPQDVTEGRATDRPSMSVFTIEVATNQRSTDLSGARQVARRAELAAYRDVIQGIFLGPP